MSSTGQSKEHESQRSGLSAPMVRVGDVASSISATHTFDRDELIFLNTGDILHGKILHQNYSAVAGMPGQAKKSIKKGDILFSEIRPANGRWALVREESEHYVVSTKLMVIRVDESKVLAEYLYMFLTSSATSSLLQRLAEARSGTFPQITFDQVAALDIALPSIDEQHRIVHAIGALDRLIEVNLEVMADLDELAMVLYVAKWDGKTWSRIGDLGQLAMGQSPPGSTFNENGEGVVFFQGVRDFGDRYPEPRVYCTAPTRRANAGDILIAVRAPIGETNVAVTATAIGRGLAALAAKQPSLALRALRASKSTWAAHEGSGTVFSSISGPDLRGALVPWTGDRSLEIELDALDAQHRACAQEITDLRQSRNELLPHVLAGRLAVGEVTA